MVIPRSDLECASPVVRRAVSRIEASEPVRCQSEGRRNSWPTALSWRGSRSERGREDGTGEPAAVRASKWEQGGAVGQEWREMRASWRGRGGVCKYLCYERKQRGGRQNPARLTRQTPDKVVTVINTWNV